MNTYSDKLQQTQATENAIAVSQILLQTADLSVEMVKALEGFRSPWKFNL